MTTIFACVKEGVMVSDSKMTVGDTWVPSTKIARHGDHLIGFAGWASESDQWLDWWVNGQRGAKPKLSNSTGLFLGPDGLMVLDSTGMFVKIERGFHGIGSGGAYAVAARLAGAKAKQAVDIACQIDANSGGDVKVEKLRK